MSPTTDLPPVLLVDLAKNSDASSNVLVPTGTPWTEQVGPAPPLPAAVFSA
jgi:hypothetical protein